jgi:hypothetical protein
MFDQFTCPNCGAALPALLAKSDIVTCQYCQTTFRVPHSFTPEPDMGDLILGADFRQLPISGWTLPNPDNVRSLAGSPPELRAKFAAADINNYALSTSGEFDDVDVSVNLKFYEGTLNQIDAGPILRYRKGIGGYIFYLSPIGTYTLAFYQPGEKGALEWKTIMDWSANNVIRKELNETNRLRVIAKGNHFKVYINGVLVTTIHDDKYDQGQVLLGVEGTAKSSVEMGFSDLQLREVLSGEK